MIVAVYQARNYIQTTRFFG